MSSPTTATGWPAAWAIDDEVIRLREWATDTVHLLDRDVRKPLTIGTAETCAIRVSASSPKIASEHASIESTRGGWVIVDAGSEPGLIVDGAQIWRADLRPGVQISLGGALTLIAESPRLIALRAALARMLGWSPARQEAVDLALRQVRYHDLRRQILVLGGEHDDHDLVPIAEELHRLTLTEQRPFVVYNPHRSTTETVEDPVRTIADLPTALAEAGDGTLCLLYGKLKRKELLSIYVAVLPQDCRTHLALCAGRSEDERFPSSPIVIPPLDRRKTEIDRIINEYLLEAANRLYCTKRVRLSAADRAWLRAHACRSLPEIQMAALRLVAVRETGGSINAAAALLGISHTALAKWLNHRSFPKT